MRIAVASGKGGTGKTLVAVNLASLIKDIVYVDCDVEEPNGYIFLKPHLTESMSVDILLPHVDETLCINCGKCMDVCQYHAIISGKRVVVFPELCHGCGSCMLQCPTKAISEAPRSIGAIDKGTFKQGIFYQGTLNIGEPMSPPVIRKLKALVPKKGDILYDSPPGTSCPMVTTIKDVDFVLLVTEPTPFGLHDLIIAVEAIRKFPLKYAVVINKSNLNDALIDDYCNKEDIRIVSRIPHSLDIARLYAKGQLLTTQPTYRDYFEELYRQILEQAK